MNVDTSYSGKIYVKFEETIVPNKIADRWVNRGLAHWPGDRDIAATGFEKTTIKVKVKKNEPTSIIIPAHGCLGYLRNCIDSIVRYTNNFEIIVIDNGTPDTSISDHVVVSKSFDMTVITNDKNMGFSYACNQGIKIAKHDYICFLNSDTLVTPNWLYELQQGFKFKNVSLTSPTTCYSRGIQCDAKIRDKRFKMDDIEILSYASNLKKGFEQTEVYGLCMLTTKEVLNKVGVFDYKRYGLGNCEETDFQWRAGKLGYKSYWVKGSYVHHFGGLTFGKIGLNNLRANEKIFEQRKSDDNLFIKNDVKLGEIKKVRKAKLSKTISSVKIGYVPHQDINSISFRLAAGVTLRVLNIAKHLKDSIISYNYEDLKDCKVVIFQARWLDEDVKLAERLKNNGVKLIFDTTDPHWDQDFDNRGRGKKALSRILKHIDVMFFPTKGLEESFLKWRKDKRIEIIPDCIDLDKHCETRKHTKKDKYTIVWFGSRSNVCQVEDARQELEKLGKEFKLKFVAVFDKNFGIGIKPFENIELETIDWTDEITIQEILKSDVVINPRYDNWKSYKSNNKTIKALALGVPCVERDFYNRIKELLLSASLRNEVGKKGKDIAKEFDSKQIAKQVAKFCDSLASKSKPKKKNKVAIVTAIAGGYDELHDPLYYDEDVDYFAYVDKDLKSNIWQIMPIEHSHFAQPRMTAKLYKILIHRFCDYDYTLWIDGSLVIKASIGELIDKYLDKSDMALFKHRMRGCVYEENIASFRNTHHGKGEPDSIRKDQIKKYRDEGMPEKYGLYECTFILRKNNEKVRKFNNEWMAEIIAFSSSDQVPFMYTKWKNPDIKIATITPGNVHASKWAYYIDHKY